MIKRVEKCVKIVARNVKDSRHMLKLLCAMIKKVEMCYNRCI